MKTLKHLLPLLGLAVAFVGCTSEPKSETSKAEGVKPAGKTLKVALLTPGPVSDAGWSALAYEGLQAIKAETGAEVNNEVAGDATKIKEAMRLYGQQKYDLVFGHGFEYNEPGVEISKDFPGTFYISSSGGKTSANAGAFRFYLEQSFYLAGMTAASLSKSGKIATIGGMDVPSIKSTFKAFAAGAKEVNPKIQVLEIYTGSFDDQAKMKQATESAISQGADAVIHQANATAKAVFQACQEKGVTCFGANMDQNTEGNTVLASAVIVAKPAFVALAKRVQSGSYKGEVTLMGMKEGAIDYIWNPKLKDKVPADLQKKIADKLAAIKDGSFTVPKDEF